MSFPWVPVLSDTPTLIRKTDHNILALFSYLAVSPSPLTSHELSELTGMHRASVYRNLESLTKEGWLEAGGSPRRYAVTWSFRQIGLLARRHDPAYEVLMTYAVELCKRLAVPAYIGYYEDGTYIASEVVHPIDGMPIAVPSGARVFASGASGGLILLAHQSEEEIMRVAHLDVPKYTDRTVTDPDEIINIVHASRAQGYAFNFGAFNRHAGSFAVPVFDGRGILASLGAKCGEDGPPEPPIGIAKELAQRASRELGYRVGMSFAIG